MSEPYQTMTARLLIPALMKTPLIEIPVDIPCDITDEAALKLAETALAEGMKIELIPSGDDD